jgi:CubicO group peptidase (beta-lactamase class C family)
MGGSVGFADPTRGIAFAYVMNQMLPSGGVDPRTRSLVEALIGCL